MKQCDLNRAVARATGKAFAINSLGFGLVPPEPFSAAGRGGRGNSAQD